MAIVCGLRSGFRQDASERALDPLGRVVALYWIGFTFVSLT
jgi:hypothetical protein